MHESVEQEDNTVSRRSLTKTVVVGGSTLFLPQFASVVSGETNSGLIELETNATVPTDTTISIRVFEDTDGTGSANNQQEKEISDGQTVTTFDALDGFEGQGYTYWMDIKLSTTDDSVTPELDSMTITLPESEPEGGDDSAGSGDSDTLSEMWDNPLVFVTMAVLSAGGLGLASKSMAISAWGSYMVFAVIAIQSGYPILENILYVTLVLIFVGFGFKLWRLEGAGDS